MDQNEVAKKAAKHHGAFNVPQVVMLVESFGELKSEVAVFELVRLMKSDFPTYGSLFESDFAG
jgi:hypothetical protein